MPITVFRRIAAENDANQSLTITFGGGYQIVTRGADVAGLDTVSALVGMEEFIVVVMRLATIAELRRRKKIVIAGVFTDQGTRQFGHVARGAHLSAMGEARSIAEGGPLHAKLVGLSCHVLRERTFAASDILSYNCCYVVSGARDEPQDRLFDSD